MLQSHAIEIDGIFVGAAVRLDRGYRFVAVDLRLYEMDSTVWPTLADLQRVARRFCRTPAAPAPAYRSEGAAPVSGGGGAAAGGGACA